MITNITKYLKLKDHEVMEYLGCISEHYTCIAGYRYKGKEYRCTHDGKESFWEEMKNSSQTFNNIILYDMTETPYQQQLRIQLQRVSKKIGEIKPKRILAFEAYQKLIKKEQALEHEKILLEIKLQP